MKRLLICCICLITVLMPSLTASATGSTADGIIDGLSVFDENSYAQTVDPALRSYEDEIIAAKRTRASVPIDASTAVYSLIETYIEAYHQSITTKTAVDLLPLYDVSNDTRQADYIVNQAYIEAHIASKVSVVHSTFDINSVDYAWGVLGGTALTDTVVASVSISYEDTYSGGEVGGGSDARHEFGIAMIGGEYKVIRHRYYDFDFAAIQKHYADNAAYRNDLNGFLSYLDSYAQNADVNQAAFAMQAVNEGAVDAEAAVMSAAVLSASLVPYDNDMRKLAVDYAVANSGKTSANAPYPYLSGNNADCTNFTSQCLIAAGFPMDNYGNNDAVKWRAWNKNSSGIYQDWTPAFTGANEFRHYLYNNDRSGIAGDIRGISATTNISNSYKVLNPGDIAQLSDGTYYAHNPDYLKWYHSLFITAKESNGSDVWYRCHSSTNTHGKLMENYKHVHARGCWIINGYYE